MRDEEGLDPGIDRYLITGWQKHVFFFSVIPSGKFLKVIPMCTDDDDEQSRDSTWKIFVTGTILKWRKKKEKGWKLVICSELFSSPRKCAFVKFFYVLRTLQGDEVVIRRGRKCCVCAGRKSVYHINNIQYYSSEKMVLNVTVVSETADRTGVVDLMKTVQEIQSSSGVPQHQDCDIDIKPEIDSDGNAIHPRVEEGQTPTKDCNTLRRERFQSFSNYDCIWEKFSFTFDIVCTEEIPCIKLKKKQTLSTFCKWDVTGTASSVKDAIVISVDTKLCSSPRKVTFVKFLFNISTEQGETLQNFEIKRCYKVFEQHTCQFRSISKESGNISLNVIIMSDTFDDEPNKSIISNNLVVDLVNSDDDDVLIVAPCSQEVSVDGMQISDICIKEENEDTEFSMSLPDSFRDGNGHWVPHPQDCISSWESCVYNYSIQVSSSDKEQLSVRCTKHYYQPSDASNKWHLTASVYNEDDTDCNTACISVEFKLKASVMRKVLVKLILIVNTIDGVKVFREKYCVNMKESLVHHIRGICLPLEDSSLEVVIISETSEGSVDSDMFFSDIENISSETDFTSEDQIAAGASGIIEAKEVKLITDISKLAEISPVISDMLKHCSATELGNRARIRMTEFSSIAVCQLLAYVSRSENLELGLKSATELLHLSVRYSIDSLKMDCESYLVSTLNELNAMNLLLLADSVSASKLKQKALRFICKNPESFAENGYDELNNRPDLLKEILIGVTSKSSTKRKKSTEKHTAKKEKKDRFMRNLEDEYMTSEQNDDDPVP